MKPGGRWTGKARKKIEDYKFANYTGAKLFSWVPKIISAPHSTFLRGLNVALSSDFYKPLRAAERHLHPRNRVLQSSWPKNSLLLLVQSEDGFNGSAAFCKTKQNRTAGPKSWFMTIATAFMTYSGRRMFSIVEYHLHAQPESGMQSSPDFKKVLRRDFLLQLDKSLIKRHSVLQALFKAWRVSTSAHPLPVSSHKTTTPTNIFGSIWGGKTFKHHKTVSGMLLKRDGMCKFLEAGRKKCESSSCEGDADLWKIEGW